MGRGRKRANAGWKRRPAMPAAAGGADRTATPEKVLDAMRRAAALCRTRIPIVTAEVETLARGFGMLPDLERNLGLGFHALRGLSEATEAVAAHLTMLAGELNQMPAVMEPDHACLFDEYRTLSGLEMLWLKLRETEFFQRASLAADFPEVLRERTGLAVAQTIVWSWLAPVFARAGMRHSAVAKSAACRATAELVNSFTDYRTTAEAVSSEVRRQLDRQREGLALLAGEGMAEKVSEQGPNLPPHAEENVCNWGVLRIALHHRGHNQCHNSITFARPSHVGARQRKLA